MTERIPPARPWQTAVLAAVALFSLAVPAGADPVTLAAVRDSLLNIRLSYVGSMPATNAASPVAVGDSLILIDQLGTLRLRAPSGATSTIFAPGNAPPGITLLGSEKILNVAANRAGTAIFVTFTSSTSPAGTPISTSSRHNNNSYQVVYRYDFNGTSLSNPHPIRSFQNNYTGHTGGGLAVLDDGSLLIAFGDNGDAFQDGRSFAQDDVSHLSKIVRLDPATGNTTTVAKGVRNPQRLDVETHDGVQYLDFIDIGGNVAEELNSIRISDLLDTGTVENFGWGRSAIDGFAREGTFYIAANGNYVGDAPIGEAGFVQPRAEWGRPGPGFFAATGPVGCGLTDITELFGDLPTGAVYAVAGGAGGSLEDVFRVNVFDAIGPTSLYALAGGRPDPRFFCFPDGSAGVLLERTGAFYQIEEFSNVPEPSTLLLVSLPVAALVRRRRRRGPR